MSSDLIAKVQELTAEVTTMRAQISTLKARVLEQSVIITELAEQQNTLINKITNAANFANDDDTEETEFDDREFKSLPKFPLSSSLALDELEQSINDTNVDYLTVNLRKMLTPTGLKRNLKFLFDEELIMSYNVDGSHGMGRLLNYPNVLGVLYNATKREGWTYHLFLQELRKELQRVKSRYYKMKCVQRKKARENGATTSEAASTEPIVKLEIMDPLMDY